MMTFAEFLETKDTLDEGWKQNLAAGAGLLAAGLGAGYALKGKNQNTSVSPAAAPNQQNVQQVDNMNKEALIRDYMEKNKNDPKYKSEFGKTFRNLRRDAEFYAAKVIANNISGGQPGKVNFQTKYGKVTSSNFEPSNHSQTYPAAADYIQNRSGSVDN